jgi:serine/threonine protein kinase HipA of HipAB toxin-antitoxin module
MGLRAEPFIFRALNPDSFHGLPGLLADSLPDRYGHALIDAWLASRGRAPESFDSVERLCYIGRRGMGALEFAPSVGPAPVKGHDLQVAELVALASEVLSHRQELFNVVARNQDDHVKNIAFLMDRAGTWELAPAYDVTYAYRPASEWTAQHQMTLNGKRRDFTLADFRAAGQVAALPRGRALRIVEEVRAVVAEWETYARRAGVDEEHVRRIAPALRLSFARE